MHLGAFLFFKCEGFLILIVMTVKTKTNFSTNQTLKGSKIIAAIN